MWSSKLSDNHLTPPDSDLPQTVLLSETSDELNRTEASDPSLLDFELESPEFDAEQVVGRYRLKRLIGSGGMGVVVLGFDELLKRDVAVKLVRRRFLNQPNIHRRFVNEALLTSQLQHPCIIPIYDFGIAEGQRPFFAMKLRLNK